MSTKLGAIHSIENIHPHQEAELLHGCRYLSYVPDQIWRRALRNSTKTEVNFQLKTQSLLLLGMRPHNPPILENFWRSMHADVDVSNHPFYLSVLGQWTGEKRRKLIKFYLHHANAHNQEFGLLLTKFDAEKKAACDFVDFVFGTDEGLSDWQGMLFFLSSATSPEIKRHLLESVRYRIKRGGRGNLVSRLAAIRNRLQADDRP